MAYETKKERFWGESHNAKRRERYQKDPEYAERQRQLRRETYRRKGGGNLTDEPSCLDNLDTLAERGAERAVNLPGQHPLVRGRVFDGAQTAEALNRTPQVIYRWVSRGMFPRPTLVDEHGKGYYADAEVRGFITVLGEHQKATPHYRSDHIETRDKVFDASFSRNKAAANAWVQERTKS